jgi:hypothetical protein
VIISRSDSIAANTRSANVLAGEQFEFMPKDGLVRLRCSASADTIKADLQIGSQTILSNALVPATNRFPIVPDDNLGEFSAARGERLFLTYNNTTGGALTVKTCIEIL